MRDLSAMALVRLMRMGRMDDGERPHVLAKVNGLGYRDHP